MTRLKRVSATKQDRLMMDFEIEELITDYLEWQVANHGKGEGVLAAWKEVFAPKSSGIQSTAKKCVSIRKSVQMKSLALFLDKEDASVYVSTNGDCDTDSAYVNKDFSSFFEALMYMAAYPSKPIGQWITERISKTKEADNELKEHNSPLKVGSLITDVSNDSMAAPAQTNNEDSPDNERKCDISPMDEDPTLEPRSKKFRSDSRPETPANLAGSPSDGKKQSSNSSISSNSNSRQKNELWNERFSELSALWNGETTVYQQHVAPNKSLTNWIKHQRKLFKRGEIAPERMAKLETIGFKWIGKNSVILSTEPQDELEIAVGKQFALSINAARKKKQMDGGKDAWDALWETRFVELVEYKKKHGDTKVPKEWAENKKLAGWVRKQREQFRREAGGEVTALTVERKQKLVDLGFVWSLRPGRLKHPLPPLPDPTGQTCIMGKEDDSRDVEPYSVDKNGYLII